MIFFLILQIPKSSLAIIKCDPVQTSGFRMCIAMYRISYYYFYLCNINFIYCHL